MDVAILAVWNMELDTTGNMEHQLFSADHRLVEDKENATL